MNIYFDSNVIVAGTVEAHVHHSRAAAALRQLSSGQDRGFISSHGLAEVYSILSRVPFEIPVSPAQAWEIVSQFVMARLEVVELSTGDYRDSIELCASRGWAGGLIHDALHIQAARVSGCSRLYTFNVKDFRRLGLELAEVVAAP